MPEQKPMRLFQSPFSGRYYVTKSYRQVNEKTIEVTGAKWDVTDDVLAILSRLSSQSETQRDKNAPGSSDGVTGTGE